MNIFAGYKFLSMKFKTSMIAMMLILVTASVFSQKISSRDQKVITDSKDAIEAFKQADPLLKNIFEGAFAYVVFPNVGKGGFLVGGAMGNGAVYDHSGLIGMAKLTQINIGFQAGGQAYREVIFFENEEVLNRFRENKIELSASASAVLATEGASAAAKYQNGIMIFTHVKGGLMYEASVGGQKFSFRKL
jgi:lipid-binding SYLF domain-containing protein